MLLEAPKFEFALRAQSFAFGFREAMLRALLGRGGFLLGACLPFPLQTQVDDLGQTLTPMPKSRRPG
jgi:hypothetical protein